jgi:tRNA pseudouridine32 synthase / 23S rRNA pseudouridine746 synthase
VVTVLASPFDELGPPGQAREAALRLQAELREGLIAPGLCSRLLQGEGGGKMFGVLVVQTPEGTMRTLRAFSGMLAGKWELPGFVPPLFDPQARAAIEPAGEAVVKTLLARAEAFERSSVLATARAAHASLLARHAAEREAMRARHLVQRSARHALRASLAADGAAAIRHALAQQSRADKAQRRHLEQRQAAQLAPLERERARLERRARALERLRHHVCRTLMRRIHDTYTVPNARGEQTSLRALYPRGEPPSGAGDCAAPRLLAWAFRHGCRPLALAEFWWGAPPASGGRVEGAFYPACKDKCGPLLAFMLEGLQIAPPRSFRPPSARSLGLRTVHQDAALVVIDKPNDLLSVPGRSPALFDSVLTRLRAQYPAAEGALLVHRLDLETSGLLLAALDPSTHRALQRQFLERSVLKQYVAWVEGDIEGDEGTIELPLRVDLDDRPRQIHDPVHGKPARTTWRVLERRGGRTRLALTPHTGRTHQLRVHAAHPRGLHAPIVGDRLYGHPALRLMLHAACLTFTHPVTLARLCLRSPPPF